MSKVHVVAKRDFLESLTVARPMAALAELIWNGFDAQSDRVQVHLDLNPLGGLQAIRVRDFGYGVNHAHIQDLFGSLGDSWKKKSPRAGRTLHGKSGKGRFRAFALGTSIEWNTTYRGDDGKTYQYRIRGEAGSLDDFEILDPVDAGTAATGTEVTVSNLRAEFGSLLREDAALELGKTFATYLTEYPDVALEYQGTRVDPTRMQTHRRDYQLGEVTLSEGRKTDLVVTVIEWGMPTERALHLCDGSGVALHQSSVGSQIRAPGFHFTAYVRSDAFRELDSQNQLELEELHPEVNALLSAARNQVKDHFRRRQLEKQGKIVERWQREQVYPYESGGTPTALERVERQVFDILAVQLENFLPAFEDADKRSRKLTFRLLAQALRDDPASAQDTLSEVLGLKKDAQDELAALLHGTALSSILRAGASLAARRRALDKLEARRLDDGTLSVALADQPWVFGEGFGVAGADVQWRDLLGQQRAALGVDSSGHGWWSHHLTQAHDGSLECLVVEAVRAPGKVDDTLVASLTNWARAVAGDAEARGRRVRWTFMAIGDELGSFAGQGATAENWPAVKILEDADLSFSLNLATWRGVLQSARARLAFGEAQLEAAMDEASVQGLLRSTYAKFIPPPSS